MGHFKSSQFLRSSARNRYNPSNKWYGKQHSKPERIFSFRSHQWCPIFLEKIESFQTTIYTSSRRVGRVHFDATQ